MEQREISHLIKIAFVKKMRKRGFFAPHNMDLKYRKQTVIGM